MTSSLNKRCQVADAEDYKIKPHLGCVNFIFTIFMFAT
jgi:hypothetical protein